MRISISGQQLELTEPLCDYVNEKAAKLTRHFDFLQDAHFVLRVEKKQHTAEATINGRHTQIHATSSAETLYAAIDGLMQKLHQQGLRAKEKLTQH